MWDTDKNTCYELLGNNRTFFEIQVWTLYTGTLAVRLRRAADAAFLLDQEMSEIREDIMKAQVMYQVKSVTLRDVLDKIQELYNVGETHKAIKYQRRLDKIDNERDITEILQLKKEIDSLLQEYKNKVDD